MTGSLKVVGASRQLEIAYLSVEGRRILLWGKSAHGEVGKESDVHNLKVVREVDRLIMVPGPR